MSDRLTMLKTLLKDRFKLTTHGESKELAGVRAGGGEGRPQDQAGGVG